MPPPEINRPHAAQLDQKGATMCIPDPPWDSPVNPQRSTFGISWDNLGVNGITRLIRGLHVRDWTASRLRKLKGRQRGRARGESAAGRCEINRDASRPVSRVLYDPPPCGRRDSHSSGAEFAFCLLQPTRMTDPETGWSSRPVSSLFGLAPGGVYLATDVAADAVGSYPTLSPLPRRHSGPIGAGTGMLAGRFAFCGTFPGVSPAGCYPAPCFRGARTFLIPPPFGLAERGCPAGWQPSIP